MKSTCRSLENTQISMKEAPQHPMLSCTRSQLHDTFCHNDPLNVELEEPRTSSRRAQRQAKGEAIVPPGE